VTGVVQKVQFDKADAVFAYLTDAKSAASAVTSIPLPAAAQAVATYSIASVTAGAHQTDARLFVAFVMSPAAQTVLASLAFGSPPPS